MERTTIMLPPGLKARASRRAKADGVSLAELIRSTLEKGLAPKGSDEPLTIFNDPFRFTDNLPGDVSANLDYYLGKICDEEVERWHSESSSTPVRSSPSTASQTIITKRPKPAGKKSRAKKSRA